MLLHCTVLHLSIQLFIRHLLARHSARGTAVGGEKNCDILLKLLVLLRHLRPLCKCSLLYSVVIYRLSLNGFAGPASQRSTCSPWTKISLTPLDFSVMQTRRGVGILVVKTDFLTWYTWKLLPVRDSFHSATFLTCQRGKSTAGSNTDDVSVSGHAGDRYQPWTWLA